MIILKIPMKPLTENKNAYFEYEILSSYEAGIELKGGEVKSIIQHGISLRGTYATLKNEEVWFINCDIPPYQPKNINKEYEQKRSRKLLLHKSEIRELIGKTKEKGLTLIPLKMYKKGSKIKLEIGLGKAKNKKDKREVIRKRDTEKEIRRELKR